jgi:hypothetical protein
MSFQDTIAGDVTANLKLFMAIYSSVAQATATDTESKTDVQTEA